MDLRDLLDVKAICDAGSFRKAAQTLGVAQPTLSNRIAYLEDKLGAPLFERNRSRSRPTQLAEIIAARATSIGQDAALLTKDIARLAAGQSGIVRMGFGSAPARILLDKILAVVATRYPELSIVLAFGNTNQLGDQLRDRELDIVVSHLFDEPHPAIIVERETEFANIIVAHPKHPIFKGPEPSVRDVILNTPMAIPVLERRYQEFARRKLQIEVSHLRGSVACADFELLIRLVVSRPWYFTAGPAFAFAPELTAGKLRRLATPVPFNHRIAVHTNRDSLSLPAIANVQKIVGEMFTETLGTGAST
jgi:DNA-binding transcriptional LysR family regulator